MCMNLTFFLFLLLVYFLCFCTYFFHTRLLALSLSLFSKLLLWLVIFVREEREREKICSFCLILPHDHWTQAAFPHTHSLFLFHHFLFTVMRIKVILFSLLAFLFRSLFSSSANGFSGHSVEQEERREKKKRWENRTDAWEMCQAVCTIVSGVCEFAPSYSFKIVSVARQKERDLSKWVKVASTFLQNKIHLSMLQLLAWTLSLSISLSLFPLEVFFPVSVNTFHLCLSSDYSQASSAWCLTSLLPFFSLFTWGTSWRETGTSHQAKLLTRKRERKKIRERGKRLKLQWTNLLLFLDVTYVAKVTTERRRKSKGKSVPSIKINHCDKAPAKQSL